MRQVGACPPEDDLRGEIRDPAVAAHLGTCVECRDKKRWIDLEPEEVDEDWSGFTGFEQQIRDDIEIAARLGSDSDGPFAGEGRRWLGTTDRGQLFDVYDRHRTRRVALRVLRTGLPARLRAVARAIDAARHPNLVGWLDILDGDPVRLSRPLVEGETLDETFERAPRARILRWVGLVASALAALHDQGVAHGGLSPANVRIDPGGRLSVVDAGLGGLPRRSPWRAPELADEEATPSADWYALGAILARHAPQLAAGPRDGVSVAAVAAEMTDPDPARRPGSARILAALLLEQGIGGLDAGRHQLVEQVDAGGMGELWRARDPVLGRVVALKRMTPKAASSANGTRHFLREARVAAQLQHPHIVPVHELDWMPDGSPYFTMKLIDGQQFGAIVTAMHEGSGWSLHRTVDALLRLTEAVAYAHGRGVIHRDLKPNNVLVGEYGEVQLIDWGIARVTAARTDRLDVDDPGVQIAFTLPWAAPEQRTDGDPAAIGPWSDVYALGAMLYHVVTGQIPAKEGVGSVLEVRPEAPRDLAAIVARASARAPGDRYPDAAAFGRDLRAWLDGEPVSAYVYSPIERLERRTRPNRGYWALGLLSLLAVGTVGWFAILGWNGSRVARERELHEKGQVLAERARLAEMSGDRIGAERLAAQAVDVAETPAALGLLARLSRRWYPRLADECATDGGTVRCPSARALTPPDGPERACGSGVAVRDGAGHVEVRAADGSLRTTIAAASTIPPSCDRSGARLAFAVGDEVDAWRIDPLQELTFLAHGAEVVSTAWSGDGALLATADVGGTVHLWDTAGWSERARLPGHGEVTGLAFDGETLLVAGSAPRAWDLSAAPAPAAIEAMVPLRAAWWGAERIATLDRHGTWRAWDPATGAFAGDALPGRTAETADAAFDASGTAVAVVTRAGALRVYDLRPVRARWARVPIGATAVAWGSGRLVAGGGDGVLHAFDPETGAEIPTSTTGGRVAGAPIVALSTAGNRVLVQRSLGAELVGGHGAWPEARRSAMSASGRVVVAHADSPDWTVRDVSAKEPVVVHRGAPVLALALSADGRTLAVASEDQTVRVFRDRDGWTERANAVTELRSDAGLAFSADGRSLLVVGAGSRAEVLDLSILDADRNLVAAVDARYGRSAR